MFIQFRLPSLQDIYPVAFARIAPTHHYKQWELDEGEKREEEKKCEGERDGGETGRTGESFSLSKVEQIFWQIERRQVSAEMTLVYGRAIWFFSTPTCWRYRIDIGPGVVSRRIWFNNVILTYVRKYIRWLKKIFERCEKRCNLI